VTEKDTPAFCAGPTFMTTQPDIAKRAYELWEQSGRPAGKDIDFWLKAEAESRNESQETKTNRAQPLLKSAKPRRTIG
jgi:hypothetical protein